MRKKTELERRLRAVVLPPGKVVKVGAGINAVGKTLYVPSTTQLTVDPTATMIIQNW